MAKVVAYKDKNTGEQESLDSMLKRFKKQVQSENILYECKKREFFMSNSLKRKTKAEEAIRRKKNKKRR